MKERKERGKGRPGMYQPHTKTYLKRVTELGKMAREKLKPHSSHFCYRIRKKKNPQLIE